MFNPKREILDKFQDETGKNLRQSTAISKKNDPYNEGTDLDIERAEWFKEVFERFGEKGKHLRSYHYDLVSVGDYERPDGTIYENTYDHWLDLKAWSKKARRFRLIDAYMFSDQRNPDVHDNSHFYNYDDPYWTVDKKDGHFDFPSINAGTSWRHKDHDILPSMSSDIAEKLFTSPSMSKEHLVRDLRPELIEVWIEKSTMDDVLKPVCEHHHVNLKTFKGHASITSVLRFIERLREAKRPGRILYISDHDRHGNSMPTGVARKLEFWTEDLDDIPNVKLERIALTQEQIDKYQLPPGPKGKSVELDALETLHEGALAEIVKDGISRYTDSEIKDKLDKQEEEIEDNIKELEQEVGEKFLDDAKEIKEETKEIRDEIEKEIEEKIGDIKDKFEDKLKPLEEKLEKLQEDASNFIEEKDIEKPDIPDRKENNNDDDILFDSSRSYAEQWKYYNKYEDLNSK